MTLFYCSPHCRYEFIFYRSWRWGEPGLDIAGQLAESYRALHQPPGFLTAGVSAPALSASCITGSAPPGPPVAESQPSARDPRSRSSARWPRSSYQATIGSDRVSHSKSPPFINAVTGESGERIGVLKTDWGGEYRSFEFAQYLHYHQIKHEDECVGQLIHLWQIRHCYFSSHIGMEFLEHRQRVAFVGHKVYCARSRVIIHKSYHVLLTGVGGCLHRATYIRMHLLQSSARANLSQRLRLVFGCLSLHTALTEALRLNSLQIYT